VDALVDTGADTTVITRDIANALGLEVVREIPLRLADSGVTIGFLHRCRVAWTIYESQGYASEREVVCMPGESVLIGIDFLRDHELSVDVQNHGLIGHAPSNAEPLAGGGWVLNAPRWYLREMNAARLERFSSGDIIRPHPAWRFSHPTMQKK
jgi:predicted aspartyl protease